VTATARLNRRSEFRPQYRLRLQSGRCLSYYEVGQVKGKQRRGDLILAIYGCLDHAKRWCDRYNAEWKFLDMVATIWAYKGSKPLYKVNYGTAFESESPGNERTDQERT
jgi:hypothetical protein